MCCRNNRKACDCPDVPPLTPMTAAEFIDHTAEFVERLLEHDRRALKLVEVKK